MEDKKMKTLAEQYHTPMFLYDGDRISRNYKDMRALLADDFEIFYSVKANHNIGICKLLKHHGSGIEVASSGELYLALAAGFNPADILFTGPGKTAADLQYAVECGIASINVESIQELMVLDQLSKEKQQKIRVGIRIHPSFKDWSKNPAFSMMGEGRQFGVGIGQLHEAFTYLEDCENLELVCFHVYAGSQIFDAETSVEYFRQTLEMFEELISNYRLSVRILDFGGGFGVSYDDKKPVYDFAHFARGVNEIIGQHQEFAAGKRFIFESGRYLLSEAGVYLTEVQYRKKLHDHQFLITDGGTNHYALTTCRDEEITGDFRMRILDSKKELETVTVAGPLCTPDDILGRSVTLNRGDRGDILCVYHAAAYGSGFSPLGFLGHPTPCELLLFEGKEYVLRQRGKKEDILKNQAAVNLPF